MAQLLHHQESAFHAKEFQGCRWSILQFFGFRQRLRSTKMLSDKKHGQEKNSGRRRRRGSYVPLKDKDSGVMDNDKNTEVTMNHKASKNNSGKASLGSLILRKLYGKEGQKEKMLPVAPKLLRTISIHYLESNEYVLDGESASNGDGSSRSTTLSMQNTTSENLHNATFNTPDGCETDTNSLLLLRRGDSHVERKSRRSISMDGILHKVPYGQKVSGDIIREELPRLASATYDRDGFKPYTGTAVKRHVNQGFRRSRSLSESLESYSHLLDSISSSESKRVLTSSKSTRDHSLDGTGVITALRRTSNADFRSKSLARHAENLVTPEDALTSHVPEKAVVDGHLKVAINESSCNEDAGGSENPMLLEEHMNDKTCDVAISTEGDLCIASLPSEVVDISEENLVTCDDDQAPSSTEADLCTDPSVAEEVVIPEKHATTCDADHIQSSTEVDSCTALLSEHINVAAERGTTADDSQIQSSNDLESIKGTYYAPDPSQEIEAEFNLTCEEETESPMSVLDVAFSDDQSSSVKHTMLDDLSLKPRILRLNDDDSVGIDDLNASTSVELPTSLLTQEIVQESVFDDFNGLQVDPKNEVELNYVNDIFKKSSFSNEVLFDEWYSKNITALQEEDCQHYEAAAAAFDFTDMSADQLLLSDLTNEALLDIYKKYSVCKSKLSWFSHFDRPKPVGHHILRELRSKVSYHLDEQPQSSVEIDTISSNDLAKSDPWINFQRDANHLGNKLADFVFDKLVTELTLELAKF